VTGAGTCSQGMIGTTGQMAIREPGYIPDVVSKLQQIPYQICRSLIGKPFMPTIMTY